MLKKNFSKTTFYLIIFPIVTMSLIFIGNYFIMAWNEPTSPPPDGGVTLPGSQWADVAGGINYPGGRVGIGSPNPSSMLDITHSIGQAIRLTRSGYDTYVIQQSTGVGLDIYNITDSRSELYFRGDGNVGISNTNPTAKLHIGGTAGVDGIRFPDGTLQTTAATGGGWPAGSYCIMANGGCPVGFNPIALSAVIASPEAPGTGHGGPAGSSSFGATYYVQVHYNGFNMNLSFCCK